MKTYLYLMITLFYLSANLYSQCVSGNCENGLGKYNYGWCSYEGQFINAIPHGDGTMDYGGGESYIGQFSNGLEHGKGTFYHADGTMESVVFENGIAISAAAKEVSIDMIKVDTKNQTSCIEGDCVNGIGTYVYPSGNKYSGKFKNTTRDGYGVGYFANGDRFEGTWVNNTFSTGVYYYNNGYKFKGKYNAEGYEYNGTYYSPSGDSVEVKNGKVVEPPPPTYTYYLICPDCKGKGKTISGGGIQSTYTPRRIIDYDPTGKTHVESWGGSVYNHRISSSPITFSQCARCNGTGMVVK
jgi:hypothetical protein